MKFYISIILLVLSSSLFSKDEYYDYADMDKYALSTPSEITKNVSLLSAYLIKPAQTEKGKVRALFRWVTENINYDVQSYLIRQNKQRSIQQILIDRTTVCDGYSRLMVELAQAADIEMVQIFGYSKGYDYNIGDRFEDNPNHAWNAVKINGKWHLLDATWGAGYIDETNQFIRQFQEHYFLTPPESFILDHLPEDQQWQLIDRPISLREFEDYLFLKPAFFRYGLSVKSHYKNTLNIYDETKVEFYAPDDVSLIGQLFQNGKPLSDYLTFSQRKSSQFVITVHVPESGEYILRLYAKDRNAFIKYEWVGDYKIVASAGKGKSAGFPFAYSMFIDRNAYLYEPINRYIQNDLNQKFRIFVPSAKAIAVLINNEWFFLEGKGDLYEGYVPIKKGKIQVLARFYEGNQFNALLDYVCQ